MGTLSLIEEPRREMKVEWIVACLLAVFAVAAWLSRLHPVLELIPNTRPVMFAGSLLALTIFVVRGNRRPAALAAFALFASALHLVPYVLAQPDPQVEKATPVRAMQYNIFYGNKDLSEVVGHIEEADSDIVAIHELLPDVWDTIEPSLADTYPHRYAVPFDEVDGQLSGGMAFLSKTPLDPIEVDPRFSPPDRVLLAAETTIGFTPVTLIGLHPHASRFESRKVDLRQTQIEGVIELVESTDNAVVVLADMNVTPTSPVYQDFLNELNWRDPHRITGWDSTWPTWGGPLGFPIDHIFVSNEFSIHDANTGDGAGSDHRSLVVDLSIGSDSN